MKFIKRTRLKRRACCTKEGEATGETKSRAGADSAGKPSIGLWLQTHSVNIARIIAAQGLFDWLLLDMEHTPVDASTAATTLAAIADVSGGSCTPLVRVAHGSMYQIKQALDSGRAGHHRAHDQHGAGSGRRGSIRTLPAAWRSRGGRYPAAIRFRHDQPCRICSECQPRNSGRRADRVAAAVENIDAIVATPGIDLIFIGPFDLHISLGSAPSLWSDEPVFLAAVEKVIAACRQQGLPYGTLTPNAEGAKARLADGFTLLGLGTDLNHLLGALHAQRKQLEQP